MTCVVIVRRNEKTENEKTDTLIVDIIALFVDNSLLPAVVVLALIAIVAIIAGVILLILYIKLRAAYKRS